jgi:Xaa-Pro dipeptidase
MKVIYNAVLRANCAVLAAVRPGVVWSDMHLLANRIVLEDLTAAGVGGKYTHAIFKNSKYNF